MYICVYIYIYIYIYIFLVFHAIFCKCGFIGFHCVAKDFLLYPYEDLIILSPTIFSTRPLNFKNSIEFHPSGKFLSEIIVGELIVSLAKRGIAPRRHCCTLSIYMYCYHYCIILLILLLLHIFRGNHLSNTTCLPHAFFKSGEWFGEFD